MKKKIFIYYQDNDAGGYGRKKLRETNMLKDTLG
jgi:hypothetical protein